MKFLQIITLLGASGEYGGPLKVAREISAGLGEVGHTSLILAGTKSGPTIKTSGELTEKVRPIVRNYDPSSLISIKFIGSALKRISQSDVVHIHFARDLIPISSALICIVFRKPYFLQTHGMVISDKRMFVRVIDKIFLKPIFLRAKLIFFLTHFEQKDLSQLGLGGEFSQLPNGIKVEKNNFTRKPSSTKRIVFCSRLDKRKRVDLFLDLARHYFDIEPDFSFEIYGPDGGELNKILESLKIDSRLQRTKYLGPLKTEEVLQTLETCDLLVLPSDKEPFPMIALETLSVGVPVVLMPSCGIASKVSEKFSEFIAETENLQGLILATQKIAELNFYVERKQEILEFCEKSFSIKAVVSELLEKFALATTK
jgi:glycosyltransferase involved in cell wall biosynthesis